MRQSLNSFLSSTFSVLTIRKRMVIMSVVPSSLLAGSLFAANLEVPISLAIFSSGCVLFSILATHMVSRDLQNLRILLGNQKSVTDPLSFSSCAELRQIGEMSLEMTNTLKERVQHQCDIQNLIPKLREQADRANAEKASFANKIYTSIRGPLNRMRGPLELLNKLPMSAQESSYVKESLDELYSLITINKELSEFSDIDFGTLPIEKKNVCSNDLLTDVLSEYAKRAHEKGLFFDVTYSGNAWHLIVNTDATRIRQIVQNLLENAITHTGKGGISVRAHSVMLNECECMMSIDLDDTGAGMDVDTIEEIKEIFEADVDDEIFTELGLGLPLCSKIAKMLGGSLGLRSIEGKGSTFTVSLPLMVDLGRNMSAISDPLTPKVLILDKRENGVLSELLMLKGVEAHATDRPLKAFANFEVNQYDLIFVDLMDQQNIEFAYKVRDCFKGEMTPMIGICDSMNEDFKTLKIELNLDEIVEKPLKGKELTRFIANKVNVRNKVNEALNAVF